MSGQKLSKEEHSRTGKIKIVNLEFYTQQKYTSINEGEIDFFCRQTKVERINHQQTCTTKSINDCLEQKYKQYTVVYNIEAKYIIIEQGEGEI